MNNDSNYLFWGILVIAIAIAIYGGYKSNQREIAVFANYTDIAFVLILILIFIFILLIMLVMVSQSDISHNLIFWVLSVIFIALLIAIIKATFLYNNGNILNFLLALYTKMLIPLALIACIIVAFILSMGLSRKNMKEKYAFPIDKKVQ